MAPLPFAPSRPVRPRRAAPLASPAAAIYAPVRWAFYAFIFSMPLESVRLFGADVTRFSLAKAVGYLFFALALTQPLTIFRRPRAPVFAFLLYLVVYVSLMAVEPPEFRPAALSRLLKLVQLLVFMWAGTALLANRDTRRRALVAFIAGSTVLALIQTFAPQMTQDRVSALGENPNTVAMLLALAVTAALGLLRDRAFASWAMRFVLLVSIAPLVLQMVRTGSRTALVALAAGLLVYLLGTKGIAARVKTAIVVFLALGIAAFATFKAADLRERWRMSFEESRLSRREIIFPLAFTMFTERPITGWGPEVHETVLGERMLRYTPVEEHNLALFILNEGGLLAGVPYLIGFLLCLRAAWKGRQFSAGVVAAALMVVLMAANMANVFDNRKVHWFVLALAAASTPAAIEAGRRRRVRLHGASHTPIHISSRRAQ